ncbi:hypothetical protein Acr_02g0001700 [Actinidia rufa]|uniref:Protein FAR1-RELATED SEQUENCE n=1 Tax=Actinidia rufa TaxID=165716 RepID=A0A7J0E687_9ERIC|nr:hypothetical protein Acr_02g0001700 [Actinidia rufa]
MDRSDGDLVSSHEDDTDIRLQTSNNLDLNIEQDCRSPKVAHVRSLQSTLSSKDESNSEAVLKVGMEFESDEYAYRFYSKYAGLVGFSVRKDWVNRSKHASDLYTPKAFEVFQREYEKCLNVVVKLCIGNGSLFEYKAKTFGKPSKYTVTYNSSDDMVTCSCMKFERWTRDARVKSLRESFGTSLEENPKLITASRYRKLCQRILKISARAADSDQAFEYAARQLDEVMQGVEKILTLKPTEETQALTSSSIGAYASESEHTEIFLDRNAIEGQDDSHTFMLENEREIMGKDPLNNLGEKISKTKRSQNVHPPSPDTVTSNSISCPPPAYVSSASSSLTHVSQVACEIRVERGLE